VISRHSPKGGNDHNEDTNSIQDPNCVTKIHCTDCHYEHLRGDGERKMEEGREETCLTLAAIHSVRGDVTRFATKELQLREKERTPEMSTTTKTDPEASSLHLLGPSR
jgi:hypothetical protein